MDKNILEIICLERKIAAADARASVKTGKPRVHNEISRYEAEVDRDLLQGKYREFQVKNEADSDD